MNFDSQDKIDFSEKVIKHESAGGFVLYEDPKDHALFVALLKRDDGCYTPKCHIRKGESDLGAAKREIREELNLKARFDFVTKIGTNSYFFTLDDKEHQKNVHMYLFSASYKHKINHSRGRVSAEWLNFDSAAKEIKFDREYLLKARQLYYFNKKVSTLRSIKDIKSISVGIPTYNGELTLPETLSSVRFSLEELPSYIEKEMLVCLDHCSDNTSDAIRQFVLRNKDKIKIKVFTNPGQKGKSSVLNYLFSKSKSQIVCFVDDDVVLDKKCLANLINGLTKNNNLRYVYASLVRKPYFGRNFWNKFWHYILGVKYEIQPYDRRSEIMNGPCTVTKRESFVHLPDGIFNEDLFIQFIYWPKTKEVISAIIYFNTVSSLSDYFKRFIRITIGVNQLKTQFSVDRVQFCSKRLFKKIDMQKIINLPFREKAAFMLNRFVRFWINKIVVYRLSRNSDYEWFRFKQDQ